MKVAWQK